MVITITEGEINPSHNIVEILHRMEQRIMALDEQVKADAAKTKENFDKLTAAFVNIADDITGLDTKIQALTDKLAEETISPEAVQMVSDLASASTDLADKAQAIADMTPEESTPPIVI